MDKTIVVSVERLARHRLYKRVIRLTTKFKAHDETNDARIGDTVLIEESRPMSATKRWRLVSVIQRAGEHGLPGEAGRGRGGGRHRGHPRRRPSRAARAPMSEAEPRDAMRGPEEPRAHGRPRAPPRRADGEPRRRRP